MAGLLNQRIDREDQLDGSTSQSPKIIGDTAFQPVYSDACRSTTENGATAATTDDEAIAAECLRVIGDRLQAEFGNQLDAMMNELDWTLAREALLADARRVLANFVNRFSDMWTRVTVFSVHVCSITLTTGTSG